VREECPREEQRYGNCDGADKGCGFCFRRNWFYLFLSKILTDVAKILRNSRKAGTPAFAEGFGVAGEFETRLLPRSLAATHRGFTFYVADPSAPFTNSHKLT
jgi:hypothetical protein